MKKYLVIIILALSWSWGICQELQEYEPNNFSENANTVSAGTTIQGFVYGVDFDYYTLVMPAGGAMTLTLSGFPNDCAFEVGAAGFEQNPNLNKGEFKGNPGQYFHFTVKGTPGTRGWIWVKVHNDAGTITSGGWGGISFSDKGPWYTLAGMNKPIKSSHDNRPILGVITYYAAFTAGTEGTSFRERPGTQGESGQTVQVGTVSGGYNTIKELATNERDKPMTVSPGTIIEGTVHFGHFTDYYEFVFPFSGTVEVKLYGQPNDVSFQVLTDGFGFGASWTDGEPGQSIVHRFKVKAGERGTIQVRLSSVYESVSGDNWGAVMCQKDGSYYLTPFVDKMSNAPATHEGKRVLLPIVYKLLVPAGTVKL